MLIKLNVPEELYLPAVQWLAEQTQKPTDAMLTALTGTNLQLSGVVDELRAKLDAEERENWALRERIKLDAEQTEAEIQRLRAELEQRFDTDESYPDHGPADDAAAGMGEPSLTAGTLTEEVLAEEVRQAALTDARHEAPELPPAVPEQAPAEEPAAGPEHGAHEAPEPPAPLPSPVPAPQAATSDGERRGLKAAATVAAQVAGPVARFLEACCEDAAGEKVPAPTLLTAYTEWAKRTGEPELTNVWLGKGLSANGLDRKQARGAVPGFDKKFRPMMWEGIRLKTDARKAETDAVRAALEAARKAQPVAEVNRDEAKVDPYITPKVIDKPAAAPIVHVRTPKPPVRREQSGITVVRADGKVTTVQEYETADEAYREPIKPEEADGLTFDVYTDCQRGTNRPYSVDDDVRALYGVDLDAIEAAIRNPQRVTIRPESKDKGYPVLSFHRGDLDVITGFRTPDRPKVMAAYVFSTATNDTYRVNHTGGGGKKGTQGLPTTVKMSVRALRQRGLEIPDTWEAATTPVEVSYQGKVLGKMKVHLADKSQIQGDYQRLLRQAHAIDRRQAMAGAAS